MILDLHMKKKKRELERLMEKLHHEFHLKQRMGHSRLVEVRASFYRVLGDYHKLTGRWMPPNAKYSVPDVHETIELANKVEVETQNGSSTVFPDSLAASTCMSSWASE